MAVSRIRRTTGLVLIIGSLVLTAACSSGGGADAGTTGSPTAAEAGTVTLLAHDSFVVSEALTE